MATSTETKIIEIKVPIGDALNQITALTKGIADLSKANQDLAKAEGDNSKQIEINKLTIKDFQNQKRQLTNEVMKEVKVSNEALGAYQKLQNEYSKAAAKAKDLAVQHGVGSEKATKAAEAANKMNEQLKAVDATVGLHVRNVGDYTGGILKAIDALKKQNTVLVEENKQLIANQKALTVGSDAYKKNEVAIKANEAAIKNNKSAISDHQKELATSNTQLDIYGGKFGGIIQGVQSFTTANGGLAGSFKAGAQAVMGMGKQLLMLLANPIVATIAAITGAVMLLVNAFKSNGAAVEKMNVLLAPFKALLEGAMTVLGKFVSFLIDGALAIGGFVTSIMSVIPGLKGVAKETQNVIALERERQRLVAAARKDIVDDAKDQLRVAELRKMIAQKDKFTTEERLKFAREADEIERKNALGDAQRANDALKLFLNDMKVRGKTQKDLTQTERDELARLQAEKYNQQKQYYDRTKKLAGVTATLIAEIESDAAAKTEETETAKKNAIEATNRAREREKQIAEQNLEATRQQIAQQLGIINEQVRKYEEALKPKDKTLVQKVTEGGVAILNASIVANEAIVKNEQETADKIAEIEFQKKQNKIDMAYAGLDAISDVSNAIGAFADRELQQWAKTNKGKAGFEEEYAKKKAKIERDSAIRAKALGILGATVSTASAIIGALAPPPIGLGPVAGIPFSIAAGVSGLAQISTILATPLPDGSTGGVGGGTNISAASIPPDLTSKMASPLSSSVNSIQSVGGSNTITSGAANVSLAQNNQPAIYAPKVELSLVELERAQGQVTFIDNISTLKS